tara:strand:- start:2063 stop:2287 length:225 start_codon:yes stop_codon:yes gene_type:complete
MMIDKLKSADTWIGALITAAIAAAIFIFNAAGHEPPAELVDALEERINDGSGEALEDVDEPTAEPEGSGEGSGL